VVAFLGLYGLATLIILGREFLPQAMTVAYGLCALANVMVAIAAGADAAHFAEVKDAGHGRGSEFGGPSLDDHIPAVGLGRPMNRTLWTLVWAVCAVIFQAMGLTYILAARSCCPCSSAISSTSSRARRPSSSPPRSASSP
jgi:hypothetical protein